MPETRGTAEAHKTQAKLAKHLGGIAREARLLAKLTQADVAERVGISTEVYGRIERGGMLPSVPTLLKLCFALGADANVLLGVRSGLSLLSESGITHEKEEETLQLRQVLRNLRRLTPTQLKCIGHVASTFAKTTGGAPSGTKDASPQGQSA
jgi:transcriptional regulator with XRE-family HTH domain